MNAAPWLSLTRKTHLFCFALISALLSGTSSAGVQQPLFPITNFYTPANPVSTFAVGDFNGDGQPDLVFASPATSPGQYATITVLLNNGSSALPTPIVTASLSCTAIPQVLTADLNNDKKLDVALSCADGNVTILFGNGDGTFQQPTVYATSGTPSLAQPVDLNGDGYLDIAASTPAAVLVMLNQGAGSPGTLLPAKSYTVPTPAGLVLDGVQAGDFNGDGKQDLIAVNTNTTLFVPFAIFYGNGDGTLQAAQAPTQVPAIGPFVVADFNHDGITDVAFLENGSLLGAPQAVQILLGNSTGVFTLGSNTPLNGLSKYTSLVNAGSTNGGKNVNLAVIGGNTDILRSDSNGAFFLGPAYPIYGTAQPEAAANGTTNLLFLTPNGFSILAANGDGTFQGPPNVPVGPNGFVTADLNGDGLTDILTVNSLFTINTQSNLVTAIGRGNGTFAITNQLPVGSNAFLLTGDFTSDGKIDAAFIASGVSPNGPPASISVYAGNGDGSFQTTPTSTTLPIVSTAPAIAGDFNGDGKLDVVIPYSQTASGQATIGLLFVPGKGDGTFGVAVPFATQSSSAPAGQILSADVNQDKIPDLIWNNTVYLGNGDGTFRQITPGFTGTLLAIGDLDGDGIPDIVIQPPAAAGVASGAAVYSGNGDGTFHASALYTAALPASASVTSAVIGDVNADGHPDLILQYQAANLTAGISVYLGNGTGNFTPDSNTYFAGGSVQGAQASSGPLSVLARLNNQAPELTSDNALDLITFTSGGATSLLNLSNPTPTVPPLLPSTTTLSSFPTTAAPTQPISFTVSVTGASPTGTVTLLSGATVLGTGYIQANGRATISASFPTPGTYAVVASYAGDSTNQPSSSASLSIPIAKVPSVASISVDTLTPGANQVFHYLVSFGGYNPTGTVTFFLSDGTNIGTTQAANGTASFAYFFLNAGTYTVYASYAGDVANLPSTTSSVTVTVMPQDFTFSAPGNYASIPAGEGATTTLTIIPTYGYNGTVKFSCGTLLAGEACTFTPPTVRSLNGLPVTSAFLITTTAPSTASLRKFLEPLEGISWAGLLGLILLRKRSSQLRRRLAHPSLLALFLALSLLQISACSSSPSSAQTQNTGTPTGTQNLTITAADSAGGPSHTLTIQLTVR
jgi:Bacterial Ig-like domain (group 3)/FG-GAP-like repeat/FG-GAP repeat